MKYEHKPWLNLVEAVVARAISDHQDAVSKLTMHPYNEKAMKMKQEVEDFFEGEVFAIFCDFDESVLYTAQKEGFANDR